MEHAARGYNQEPAARSAEPASPGAGMEQTPRGVAATVLGLQRSAGNRTAGALLRHALRRAGGLPTKLAVSRPGDSDEQEANHTAAQVMLPEQQASGDRFADRQERAPQPLLQAGRLRRKENGGVRTVPLASPIVGEVIAAGGRPLDPATRAFMEPRFGHDFGGVRVHTGARAAESARAVNALAYTVGRDVVFGAGQYAPGTGTGRSLIAHELSHVIQQSGSGRPAATSLQLGAPDSREERQAEQMAGAAASGRPMPMAGRAGQQVMRATRTFALTFDDGPHAAELGKGKNLTEKVLDTLKARSIKAGFFVQTGVSFRGANTIGRALVARMHTEKHKVGIHTGGTTDHELHTTAEKTGRLESELEAAKKYITKETGEVPTLVRPPTGAFNKAVLATYAKVGLTNLMWDMDGDQGKNLSLSVLKDRIKSEMLLVQARGWKPSTSSAQIVVLYHDIQSNTAKNLGALIDHIKKTTVDISGGKDSAAFAAP